MRRGWRRAVWVAPAVLAAGLGWLLVPSSSSEARSVTPTTGAATAAAAPTTAAGRPASTVDGATLYRQTCSSCHGVDGRGSARGPSLAGVGMAAVDFQLQTGRMPKRSSVPSQPPYTPKLSQAEIAALDQYVTDLVAHGGPGIPSVDPAAGSVADGGELYRVYCAACHEVLGRGGELVDRPVPFITEATPKEVGEAVRAGAYQMPKFGTAAISPSQLNSIVAYVHNLEHPADVGGNPLSHLGPVSEGVVAWFIGMLVLLALIRWIGKRG